MTENKAINEIIKEVCSGCYGSDEEPHRCSTCGFKMAKDALKEIQQYRAIGTVKEIKIREAQFARLSEGYLSDLTSLREYQAIGTVEEFNALKEKNEPKKVDEEYCCPICHTCGMDDDGIAGDYCTSCGQALDWSE